MIGWFLSGPDLCIAMEYFPLGDLHAYLHDRPPLSEQHAQEIISQVLQGLNLMHEGGFAHRDIKPRNILIQQCPTSNDSGTSWWVKLADFGISKRLDSTVSSAVVGTFDYMSPEMLDGRNKASDLDFKAADMWAVGVATFYLLSKTHGFVQPRLKLDKDVQNANVLLPLDIKLSDGGLAFIFESTVPDAADRLTCGQAMRHTWMSECLPGLSLLSISASADDEFV